MREFPTKLSKTRRLISTGTTMQGRKRPWGFFATLGWGLPIALITLVVQDLVHARALVVSFQSSTAQLQPPIWGGIASVSVLTPLTLAVVMLRRGYGIADYFALRWVRWRTAVRWMSSGIVAALLVAFIRRVINGPAAYVNVFTQDDFVLLVVTTVVLVPISEELFFRGFLLTGLRETRFGDAVAIPLGAIMWAVPHANASWHATAAVFLLGCLLGVMRKACRSILPGCCVHAVLNALGIGILVMDGLGATTA